MKAKELKTPDALDASLIAPCGMNCGLCSAYLRDKKICPGCNGDDAGKPKYCAACAIKRCAGHDDKETSFCYACEKYPCARLRRLDKRYRSRYGMSMIENLDAIRSNGLAEFIHLQRERWQCPGCGGIICVHQNQCLFCGRAKDEHLTRA